MTELDDGDPRIAQLPTLVDEGLLIEERSTLEAEYGGRTFFALNDVVVRKGDVSRIVPFGLSLDNEHIADIPADGICIATATGSTAYFLSAGGSIISPRVDAFGIVPRLPHTLFSRPLIVPRTSEIGVGCDSNVVTHTLSATATSWPRSARTPSSTCAGMPRACSSRAFRRCASSSVLKKKCAGAFPFGPLRGKVQRC